MFSDMTILTCFSLDLETVNWLRLRDKNTGKGISLVGQPLNGWPERSENRSLINERISTVHGSAAQTSRSYAIQQARTDRQDRFSFLDSIRRTRIVHVCYVRLVSASKLGK